MPRRPRLPRPKLGRPKLPRPKRPKLPKLPNDLWFRFVTRLRAIGYGTREKAQQAWKLVRRGAAYVAEQWTKRSRDTHIKVGAVAGVVVLYAILKFVPVPGVPCQVSAAKECAPPNETIAFVPQNAVLYAQLTVDRDSHQYELASDLGDELPDVTQLANQVTAALPTPSGKPVDVARDILPWAKDDVALTLVPGQGKTSLPVFIVGVGDKQGAEQFLTNVAPPGQPQQSEQQGSPLSIHPGGFASAFAGDEVLFGDESAVRAALDAGAGRIPRLEGSDQDAAREGLPEVRFSEIYLSREGVQRLLVGRGAGGTQLETFVDYGATSGMAASATFKDDGVEVDLVSRLDEKLLAQSPTFFSSLPEFEPDLAGEAGNRALGYVAVGEVGPTLTSVLASAGAQSQGLAGSLRTLAETLQQQSGVDPLKDLLPALGGQAALVAEPTDGVPFASLIVDDVDEEKAKEALARLQGPLVQALGTQGGVQVPSFQEKKEDGVSVSSLQVSPNVNLSYAVFDGKLVVSTDPAGIAQVRAEGDDLAGSGNYERVTEDLPDEVSALIFLNLDEVLGLAEDAGLAEDPLYASLSDDISNIPALGLAVRGGEDQIRSEIFLATE